MKFISLKIELEEDGLADSKSIQTQEPANKMGHDSHAA